MPNIFPYKGYRFFFYSNEGNPREPAHIHVRKGSATAKFWLMPEVKLASAYGFSASELNELEGVAIEQRQYFERRWNEFFGH